MHGNTDVTGKELQWESGEKDRLHNKENLRKHVKIPTTKRLVKYKKLELILGLDC